MWETQIGIIPIEPFPRRHLNLHEEIIRAARDSGIKILETLQATSITKQEKIFEDYFEPYRDQIENWIGVRIDDVVYHSDQIKLDGFILWKSKDAMIYSSPYFWYLESMDPYVLQNFLETVGISVSLKAGGSEIIIEKVGKSMVKFLKKILPPLKQIKPSLILTTHGTVDERRLNSIEKHLLADFAKDDYITFLTGWDFIDKGREMVNDILKPRALIMEGGTVLYTEEKGWNVANEIKLFNSLDLNYVKRAWYVLVECVSKYLQESIFMSQANRYSICVYINPPSEIVKGELDKYRREEISTSEEFSQKLMENNIEAEPINNKTFKVKKDIESLYAVEKINARYRTFMPYKLELKENYALVTLLPRDYRYEEIKREVKDGTKKIPLILNEIVNCMKRKVSIGNRIAPQTDVCIDIFVRSKDEIIDSKYAIEAAGLTLRKIREIIYISKGTRSDKPFIEKLNQVKDIWNKDFCAYGDMSLPRELEDVGVRRVSKAKNTEELIKELANIRNRTNLKFFLG